MAKKKNSLVNNINKRKRAGKSRSKAKSTISKKDYKEMQAGWPKKESGQAGNEEKVGKESGKKENVNRWVAGMSAANPRNHANSGGSLRSTPATPRCCFLVGASTHSLKFGHANRL